MKYRIKALFVCFLVFIIICFPCSILADDTSDTIEPLESIIVSANTSKNVDLEIYSKSAVIYERNSHIVLYEKNSNEVVPMASTTKIMTCILILENCNLDTVVTVSSNAASTIGSRLGLSTNDQITVQDLLPPVLLKLVVVVLRNSLCL